jgi:uncharacterized protein
MPEIATRIHGVEEFLSQTQALIEREEAAHQILFDLCAHLKKFPEAFLPDPYFKVIDGDNGVALAAVMARPHHLVLGGRGGDLNEWIEGIARDLLGTRWNVPGVIGPSVMAYKFAGIWANLACVKFIKGKALVIYEIKKLQWPPDVPGKLKLASMTEVDWITEWIHQSQKEALPDRNVPSPREVVEARIKACDVYYWEDEKPVSLAAVMPAGLNGVRISLVYTPPEFRGKGYASICTASVTKMLLDARCKVCTAISEADDELTNRMYERIGYVKVCDVDEYIFETIGRVQS